MEQRMYVKFTAEEMEAILSISRAECRPPREQMRFLVREAARARGLLPAPTSFTPHTEPKQVALPAEPEQVVST